MVNDESLEGCTTSGEGPVVGLGLGGGGHFHRLRPGLGISTTGEEVEGGHLVREFEGEAWGRFSPASFKQRVLRERFHWVG